MSDPLFFDYEPSKMAQWKRKLSSMNAFAIGALSMGTILVLILSVWIFYPKGTIDPETLPVIQASLQPIRIAPDEIEEIDITQRDSKIYDTFNTNRSVENPPENLLQPESGKDVILSKEELFAGLKQETQTPGFNTPETQNNDMPSDMELAAVEPVKTTKTYTETEPDQANNKKPVPGIFIKNSQPETQPETLLPPPAATTQVSETKDITNVLTKMEPAAGATRSGVPKDMAAPVTSSNAPATHFVQLASIQDAAKIKTAWNDLTKKYAALQNVAYRNQEAIIPGKGTFYRIQAGPFPKANAESLCANLKAQGGSCLVVSK